MSTRAYAIFSGVIFALVAVAHLVRLVGQEAVLVSGWEVPLWASAIALIVAGFLSYEGFRVSGRTKSCGPAM